METRVDLILKYTSEEYYALKEEVRKAYYLEVRQGFSDALNKEWGGGQEWVMVCGSKGIVYRYPHDKDFPTQELKRRIEREYDSVAFLFHRPQFTDEFSHERSNREPTLNERLEARLTGL